MESADEVEHRLKRLPHNRYDDHTEVLTHDIPPGIKQLILSPLQGGHLYLNSHADPDASEGYSLLLCFR